MPVPVDLIRQLCRQRLRLRLSQRGVAMRVGIDKATVGRWERRAENPRLDSFCAWAEELGYDIVLVAALASARRASLVLGDEGAARCLGDGVPEDRF